MPKFFFPLNPWGLRFVAHDPYRQLFINVHISSLGMFAIRADRDYVVQEDFMKAVRKVSDNKKLETKLDYKPI